MPPIGNSYVNAHGFRPILVNSGTTISCGVKQHYRPIHGLTPSQTPGWEEVSASFFPFLAVIRHPSLAGRCIQTVLDTPATKAGPLTRGEIGQVLRNGIFGNWDF